MRVLGVVVLFAAVLAFAGCSGSVSVGGSPELSAEELERGIGAQYAERVGEGITLVEINCEDADAEKDAAIECRGRDNRGIELEIGGEITAVEGDDRASYDWRVERAYAPGLFFERSVRRVLTERQDLAVTGVRCPERIEIVVGSEVECDVAIAGRGVVPSILTLTDGDGGFKIRSA